MKSKITAILLALALLTIAAAGCAAPTENGGDTTGSLSGTETPYDYDLSQYVTLGEYKNLPATGGIYSFSEEDFQAQLAMILTKNAEPVEVTDRSVQDGDTVNIDYTGYMDGEAFENGSDVGFDLVIGSGSFIPGFEDGLIGAVTGETRTVDATFPDPYSPNPDFAGKTAQFEVTVNKITTSVVPEYNEDFLRANYPEYDSLAAFEESVKASMEEEFNYNNEMSLIDQVWAQVMDNATIIGYPEKEYNQLFEDNLAYYENVSQTYYNTDLETYLSEYENKTLDEFKTEVEAEVKNFMAEELVMYAIIRAEGIELTEEEYQSGLESYATSFNLTTDELLSYYTEDSLRTSIQLEKVLRYVVENANITNVE